MGGMGGRGDMVSLLLCLLISSVVVRLTIICWLWIVVNQNAPQQPVGGDLLLL